MENQCSDVGSDRGISIEYSNELLIARIFVGLEMNRGEKELLAWITEWMGDQATYPEEIFVFELANDTIDDLLCEMDWHESSECRGLSEFLVKGLSALKFYTVRQGSR